MVRVHVDRRDARYLSTGPMPRPDDSLRIRDRMSANIIVSYDGTANDDDAVALGKLLAQTGASLALA